MLEISSIISLFTSIDPNKVLAQLQYLKDVYFRLYLQLILFLPLIYNRLGRKLIKDKSYTLFLNLWKSYLV